MFKNIFRTFVSRIISAIFTFGVVFITSRALGPENYGTIGLIMVAVGIALLFSSLIGGTSLVYFTSRINPSALFIVSALWGFLMTFAVTKIMALLNLYPSEFFFQVFLISLIACISQNLMCIILGNERILQQNIIMVFQIFIHFSVLLFIFHGLKQPAIVNYLNSVLISHFLAMLMGFIFCSKYIFPLSLAGLLSGIIEIIKYGYWIQLSTFIQLMNYRLSYYIVDWFLGREKLGIYTLAVQLAESFWLLPRSISTVQFSYISNLRTINEAVIVSYKLMQSVMICIAGCTIPIFFIPENWFLFVIGPAYTGIKSVVLMLIPAVIFFSGVIIISAYFSGIGKVKYTTVVSATGLIFTAILNLLLVYFFGLYGAALTTNICYIVMFIFSMHIFIRLNNTTVLKLSREGIDIKSIIRNLKNKSFPLWKIFSD